MKTEDLYNLIAECEDYETAHDGSVDELCRAARELLKRNEKLEFMLFKALERDYRKSGYNAGVFDMQLMEWHREHFERLPDEERKECEYHRDVREILRQSTTPQSKAIE